MKLASVVAMILAAVQPDDATQLQLLLVAICCAILACAPQSHVTDRFWAAVERERSHTDKENAE